jgi:hypothetical protein
VFQAVHVDDIAAQDGVDRPQEEPAEPPGQQGQRLTPDFGKARGLPDF